MQRANLGPVNYATRYRPTTNKDNMSTYEQTLEYQYTAGADGETVIVLPLIGMRIVQIEREIKPIYADDYAWNGSSGQLTLLNGVELADNETLFILYAKTITT